MRRRGAAPQRALRAAYALMATASLAVAATAAAGGWRALELPDRLDLAHDAFVGRVASVDVDVRDGEPWTIVAFDVERWWRREGRATDEGPSEVRVAQWGGRAPGVEALLVAGAPSFAVGDRVVLWLRSLDGVLAVPIVGVDQGVWWARDGGWRGPDGRTLGIGVGGRPTLDAAAPPDALLFDALAAAFRELEEEAP